MCVGITSGLISGLIVALSIFLYSHYKKPRLELRYLANNLALLYNHRLTPIVVGGFLCGNFSLSNGKNHGYMVKPFEQIELININEKLPSTITALSFKRAPLRPFRWSRKVEKVMKWSQPTHELVPVEWELDGEEFTNEDVYPHTVKSGWKYYEIRLTAF